MIISGYLIMTASYIIWHLNIWNKYMIISNLTVYYQALCEYWQSQDSTQTVNSWNIIGHINYNQLLLVNYWKNSRNVEKCVMWLWCLSWLKKRRDPSITRQDLSKALHPSSFHCCQPQDSSHVFVLPSLLALCARRRACPLVFVCPRKLLKERAS